MPCDSHIFGQKEEKRMGLHSEEFLIRLQASVDGIK